MPLWSMLLFFGVWSALQVLLHYYVWRRLVGDTELKHPVRRLATVTIVALGLSVPLTMWLSRLLSTAIGQTMGWPAFLWLGMLGQLLMALAFIDVGRLVVRAGKRVARGKDSGSLDAGRREFLARLTGGGALIFATGRTAVGFAEVMSGVPLKRVEIPLRRLPATLDGFTIVQLTDIHIGLTVTKSYVQALVDTANSANADLIVITGDVVDGPVSEIADAVAPLGELKAPHGVFLVTGNHEYYAGVDEWLAEFRRIGIRVLRNERISIDKSGASFDLVGIDDHNAGRAGVGHGPDLDSAMAGADPSRASVLLAHQPRQVHVAKKHNIGLQLSGHTHGGQIWPWHYAASAQQGGLLAGLSQHDETVLYVSRGCGYWGPPVRIGAPAEISEIVLRARTTKRA